MRAYSKLTCREEGQCELFNGQNVFGDVNISHPVLPWTVIRGVGIDCL
jgi:hypothetical protein